MTNVGQSLSHDFLKPTILEIFLDVIESIDCVVACKLLCDLFVVLSAPDTSFPALNNIYELFRRESPDQVPSS
jgi:hypothetical protein